jgi:hypothetical protein
MTSAQLSADGYAKLCRVFAAENATLSVGLLPAEPFRPPSNAEILKALLGQGDGVATFSSGSHFTGFKISKKILRLE